MVDRVAPRDHGADFEHVIVAYRYVGAEELAERAFGPAHVRQDAALDDDFGLGRNRQSDRAASAHWNPSRGELGESVAVRHEVLAANQQLARSGRCLGREDPALNQFCGCIARQEPGVRIERVPAARVIVDHTAQARRELCEVFVARQAASPEQLDLLAKPVDGPTRRHHARIIHRHRDPAPALRERSPLAGDGTVVQRARDFRSRHHRIPKEATNR